MSNAQENIVRESINSFDEQKQQITCKKTHHQQLKLLKSHQASSTSDRALIPISHAYDVVPCSRPGSDMLNLKWASFGLRSRNRRARVYVAEENNPFRKRQRMRVVKMYTCNLCAKSFSKYHALGGHKAHHLRMNNKKKKNKPAAIESGPSRTSIEHNLAIIVPNKLHKCQLCGREFANGRALGGHKGHCKYRVCAFDLIEYPPKRNQ